MDAMGISWNVMSGFVLNVAHVVFEQQAHDGVFVCTITLHSI